LGNSRTVSHDGTVVRIEGEKVQVKIISQSACADCHAKGVCTAADMDEKIIDAISSPDQHLKEGDHVSVVMEERLGKIALVYGFVLPFLVMVAVLFIGSGIGWSETYAALAGLASLAPYYLLLYYFRHKIEKDFSFKAEKKNKY